MLPQPEFPVGLLREDEVPPGMTFDPSGAEACDSDRSKETITAARNGFVLKVAFQRYRKDNPAAAEQPSLGHDQSPQTCHRPKILSEVLLCVTISPGMLDQHQQYLEGLLSHFHSYPKLPQFAGTQIHRVGTEQSVVRSCHFHARKSRDGNFGWPKMRLVRNAVKKPTKVHDELLRRLITHPEMNRLPSVPEMFES